MASAVKECPLGDGGQPAARRWKRDRSFPKRARDHVPDSGRSAGWLCRQRSITRITVGGSPGADRASGGGSLPQHAVSVSGVVARLNGCVPVSISSSPPRERRGRAERRRIAQYLLRRDIALGADDQPGLREAARWSDRFRQLPNGIVQGDAKIENLDAAGTV